jgi:hypothetical protein
MKFISLSRPIFREMRGIPRSQPFRLFMFSLRGWENPPIFYMGRLYDNGQFYCFMLCIGWFGIRVNNPRHPAMKGIFR